jgi:antitoxin (DNA-binding transcriptional repressor) of toxin-antitoxin stability system
MKTEMSKSRFKARALEVFREIERTGEPVIITDHGKPSLILKRYSAPPEDGRKLLTGSVLSYVDPLAPVADDDWEALD